MRRTSVNCDWTTVNPLKEMDSLLAFPRPNGDDVASLNRHAHFCVVLSRWKSAR